MKKLASLVTDSRLTDLCPPTTSTISNPACRNFVKSQKALLYISTGSLGLQVPMTIAKFSDLVIARLLTATS